MPLSIILPANNEALALPALLAQLRQHQPEAEWIVVDDGSTACIAADAEARVIRHPYPMGNGAAIKTGARAASGMSWCSWTPTACVFY